MEDLVDSEEDFHAELKEAHRRNQLRAELARDSFLPMRVLLTPAEYRGNSPLGEPWLSWAVEAREEVALGIFARPDYLEAHHPGQPQEQARIRAQAIARWPSVRERVLELHREVLRQEVDRGRTVAHLAGQRSAEAALRFVQEPELCTLQTPKGVPLVGSVLRHAAVRRHILRDAPDLGFLPTTRHRSIYQALLEHRPERALQILRLPGVMESHTPGGEPLLEALVRHRPFAAQAMRQVELGALPLPGKGCRLAHEALRQHPRLEVEVYIYSQTAALRDEAGETVAHWAVRLSPNFARDVLHHRQTARLRNAEGVSVRRLALQQPTAGKVALALKSRLHEMLDNVTSASRGSPPSRQQRSR